MLALIKIISKVTTFATLNFSVRLTTATLMISQKREHTTQTHTIVQQSKANMQKV